MAQDYTHLSYSNYDYQDNIYIVSNVKPAPASAATPLVIATGAPVPAPIAPSSTLNSRTISIAKLTLDDDFSM